MTLSSSQSMAMDVTSLEATKRRVREAPAQGQREVAKQFEALFLQMMVQRMREASPKDGLFNSDQMRLIQSMGDEQLALNLADPGIGLAKALLAQMQRFNPTEDRAAGPAAAQVDEVRPEVPSFTPLAEPMRLYNRGATASAATRAEPVPKVELSVPSAPASATESPAAKVAGKSNARAMPAGSSADLPGHIASFVSKIGDAARAVAKASGLPAKLILGQAALESGWGKSEIKMPNGSTSYNIFGIKATGGWKGKIAEVLTTEYSGGVARKVVQPFRAYDSYEEALADYTRLITQNPRYEKVVTAPDEIQAARQIQRAGYATDPRYADKLISVMAKLDSVRS